MSPALLGVVGVRAQYEALAAVAHDLRLPLTHIKGFVSSLRRADVQWDEQTRSEFLEEIDLETDRLAELVDSLLTCGALAGSLSAGPQVAFTDPVSILDGALHRIRGLLGGRVVRRKVPRRHPAVGMNASQMERVLTNLLHNAIKYSPPGTPIGIATRITAAGELEFTVDDKGAGIRVEDRTLIFEPFFRKQTATHANVPGHGLGLAICQSIVLAHGGRMRVTDRRGGGARFSVFIPGPIRTESVESRRAAKDGANDPTKDSRRRRRGTDAQASQQQSEGQRLRRAPGSRWHGGAETLRRAPVRPVAA